MSSAPAGSSFVAIRSLADPACAVARVLREKVSEYESEIIKNEVVARVGAGRRKIAIDMSDVRLLTSAGIGALITVDRACRGAGGKLVLYGLSEELLGLIKLTRLDKVFTIRDNEAAATAALA